MNEYSHNCIKCTSRYQSNDPEPYYCSPCNEEKKNIAKEVDKKMAGRVSRKQKSDFQIFNELAQSRGVHGFVNIKDLGINL